MSYYTDENKITFDRAEVIVERYTREYGHRRERVTTKDVARAYDVKQSQHNLVRLNRALDQRLEVVRPAGARATQYRLEL
jgi:uncharacterized FlgJ-related protein